MGIPGGELLPLQSTGERIILSVGRNSHGLNLAPAHPTTPHTHHTQSLEAPRCMCFVFVLLQVARKLVIIESDLERAEERAELSEG